uniref:Putative secreted protein n=1 Tax=Rhipicephalus microplus TaxID=6941 RepID=A0A6G5A3T3_RHIMP
MILTLLLCVLVALTAQAMGPQEAGRAILPGAIIVDVRHGLLLPQGHSREELEPVIRDSLRILDLYLHETGGTNRPFRVKRSAAAKHLLTAKNIRTRVDERRRANVKLPCRGKARAKRSSRYALNAFSINPKPANKSGGYYTLFARVSEAVLQDLMARNPPAGESNLSRHHQSPNHYSGELFQYVVNSTAGQPRLPLPPKAGHSWRRELRQRSRTRHYA